MSSSLVSQVERDAYLAWSGEECVAYTMCMLDGDHSTGYIDTIIDPAAPTSAALLPLQAAAEKHIRQTLGGDQLPPERPFYIDTFAVEHAVDTAKLTLLQQLGYFEVRRFFDMLIQLEGEQEAPTLSDGLQLRPFQRDTQARAYHATYLESFRDHWGNISIYDFAQFAKHFDNPEFDEALWFAAWAGNEIAGRGVRRAQPSVPAARRRRFAWRAPALAPPRPRHGPFTASVLSLPATGLYGGRAGGRCREPH